MATLPISIDFTDPGNVSICVDGVDVTRCVRRAVIDLDTGQMPVVGLEVWGAGDIKGEGVVREVVAANLDHREVVMAWLNNIDPGAVEHEFLETGDFSKSTGEGMIDVLRRKAAEG